MTALTEACADARQWLPEAAVLVAQPDTGGVTRGGRPGSRPPWNPAAANATWDFLGVIADILARFQYHVTGHSGARPPASATGAVLAAIERLSYAVPQDLQRPAVRDLARCAVTVQRLPAVDQAERPQRVPGLQCQYCHIPMLMTLPKAGIVYCKLGGFACWDSNGDPPRGRATVGRLGPCIEWSDGLVT